MNNLSRCLLKHSKALKDFDTEEVVDASRVYVSRGKAEDEANVLAIEDHLRELHTQRDEIVARVVGEFKTRDPRRYAEVEAANAAKAALPEPGTIDHAAHAAATSPLNSLPQPTDKQKEAGNYKVGRVRVQGLDISIENPRGSVRSGTSPDGQKWQNTLAHHYGYIRGTTANDGDHLDVFLTDGAETAPVAWVIDQKNRDGGFDEHKVILGPTTEAEARAAYLANYAPGWDGIGAITSMPIEAFKSWAGDGKAKRNPLAYDEAQTPQKTTSAPDAAEVFEYDGIVPGFPSVLYRMGGNWYRDIGGGKLEVTGQRAGDLKLAEFMARYPQEWVANGSVDVRDGRLAVGTGGRVIEGAATAATENSTAVAAQHENATAPEHVRDDTGVTVAELKQIADAFRENIDAGADADVTHVFDAPAKSEVVRLNDKAKAEVAKSGWLTPAQAKARVQEWRDHAAAQYDDDETRSANSRKVVISLFDLTGKWSQPWEEAGYQVFRFDIQNGDTVDHGGEVINIGDINNFSIDFFNDVFGSFDDLDIHAILAACPCTDFAVSGARHFAAKDADGRTVASIKLVRATLNTIEFFKPAVWALENPVGRIEGLTGLPPWRLSFDPNHLGDTYTKKTLIWGRFNADLPVAPVEPTEGSKMHSQYGGKSQATKNARSATPEGFAYGFFMANNAADNPVLAIAGKYDRLDRGAIEAAVKAGVTAGQISEAVDDFYYMDLDDAAANAAIRELAGQKPDPKGGLPAVKEQLFVEFGGQTFPVESLRDASEKWEQFRDETGVGSSEVENLRILDQTGKQIAYVSYNGKVWQGTDYVPNADPVYVPTRQRDTAAVDTSLTDALGLDNNGDTSLTDALGTDGAAAEFAGTETPAAEKKSSSQWLHDEIVLLIDQKGRTKDRKTLNKVVELLKQRMEGEDVRAARVKTYAVKFKKEARIADVLERVIARLETEDREASSAKRKATKQAKEGKNGAETTQAEPQQTEQPEDTAARRVRFISRGRTEGDRFAEAITEFKDIAIPELPGRQFFIHAGDGGQTVITERETGKAMARGNTEKLAYKALFDVLKARPAADIEKIIAGTPPLTVDLMNAAVVDLENREEGQKVSDEQGKQSEREQDETARVSPFAGRWVRSNAGADTIRAAAEMTAYINQHTDRDALRALWHGMVSNPDPIDGVGTVGSRTAFILDRKPYVVDIQERGGSERQVLREVALEDIEAAPSKYFDASKPVYHKDAATPSSATTYVAIAGPEGNKRFAADVRRLFGIAVTPAKGEISPALAEAVRLLGAYTASRFNIDALTTPAKASVRAHIMAALQGVDKVPQARAGITALRDEFYRQAGITGETPRDRELAFEAWAESVAKKPEAASALPAPSDEDVARAQEDEKRAAAVRAVEKEAFAALSVSTELINAVTNTPDNATIEAQAQVAKWIGAEIFKAAQSGDTERAKALDAMMKDGQPVLPESFFTALIKDAQRAIREARLERLKESGEGALTAAMTKAGGDAAAMTAFRGGWEHALAGKTKSTLPNDASQVGGYEAAQAWLKTDEGRAANQGKRGRKMQDGGVDLRRWFDEQKGKIGTGESDAVVDQLDAATKRSELFRVVQPATPGGLRWLEGFRGRVRPFKRWLMERGALQRTYGRYFTKSTSDETRIRAYIDGETYRPGEEDETRDQRIQRLRDAADEYVTLTSLITSALDGGSVKSLAQSLRAAVFKPGVDRPSVYSGEGLTENGTQIVPLLLDAGRDMNKYGAEDSYTVRELIKTETQAVETTRKQPLTPPRLDRVDRDGEDYRAGQNVSADNFKRTFNFADGKIFGEYVKAKQDQDHLNYSFDAFGDLAKVLGVPPAAMSLGGRLYFTIGKLGAGKFAAHYTKDQPHPDGGTVPVINVTNTRGDGTVAHEWGHALDLTPQKLDGDGKAFSTFGGDHTYLQRAIDEIRNDLRFGYNFDSLRASVMSMLRGDGYFTNNKRARNTDEGRINNAIQSVDYYNTPSRNRSTYYLNALKLDGSNKKDPYWSNGKELFARAFEAWVSDAMENQNTYLVNPSWVGDGAVTGKTHRGTPYPTSEERERFAMWFDALRKSLVYDDDAKVLGLDADKWEENKPKHPAEWKQTLADLKAEIPAMLEQVKREQAAKKKAQESAVDEGRRMKAGDIVEPRDSAGSLYQKYAGGVRVESATVEASGQARITIATGDGKTAEYYAQFFRIAKTAEQAEAEAAPRVAEEMQQPSPEPEGELEADDLSRVFDEAAAELHEETQEQPAVEAMPATITAADGWTEEDLAFLRNQIEGGQIILLAGNELGLPTIHDMPSDKVRHMGFGVFTVSTPEWEGNWMAGGAMSHTPGGKPYTGVSVTRGEIDPTLFDREQVLGRLSELLRAGTAKAVDNSLPPGWTEASPGGMATSTDPVSGGIVDKVMRSNPEEWFVIPENDAIAKIEGMGSRAEAFAALRDAVAASGNKEKAANLLSGRGGRIETDAEKAGRIGSLDDATDKSAADLAAKAAKLGVKGVDEAMKGLVKLFGGGPGKLQSFPAGLDEETYKTAKPHFEAALKAFQEAGKTIKELFKFLIENFGVGVKEYALYFAREQKLTADLGAAPSATRRVAQYVRDNLKTGTAIRWQELFAAADKAWGGTQADGKYTVKDAYDAMEAGVNLYLMDGNWKADAENADQAVQAVRNLKRMIDGLPTQTKRTAEMDEFQQFSTPPALAYVASWVANITAADTLMEPSAGTGDLAVYAKNTGARLILNELSSRRAAVLKDLFPGARLFTENAEQLNNVLPDDARPTVVVMNPPFSSTAGRVQGSRDTMNGAKHIEQALKRLPEGGRLVAIVGEGMAADKPAFRAWWKKIGAEYNVRANIGIDGKEYAKYGTTFDNQILVIDKNGPTINTVVTGKVDSVADLPALLESIRNDRPEIAEREQTEPAGDGAAGQGRDHAGQQDATGDGAVDAVGAGQRPTGGQDGSQPGERPTSGLGGTGARPGAKKPGGADAVPDDNGQRGSLRDQPGRDGSGRSGGDAAGGTDRGGAGAAGKAGGVKLGTADAQANTALTDSVFEPYRPQRLKIDGAKAHPGKLVQSAAMAAVEPPNPTYTPNLPKEVIAKGLLSEAQIEAVVYAGQAHSEMLPNGERRGFFIGDSTGVGKGREIAGIILDNMRQGRKKAVWVSFNEGLLNDAKRDFSGVGGDPDLLFFQGKTKAGNDITAKQGILFTSYSTLKSGEKKQANDKGQAQGKTRLDQMVAWLGENFDGVVVFDEAHSMGNVIEMKGKRGKKKPALQAIAGVNLQAALPKARVVYVSATGATEVTNLGYATRLGLWGEGTAFADVKTFIGKIAEGGVAAMELISRDMKALGMYISRSLSFDGVTYQRLDHDLTPLQHDIYNELAKAWQIVLQNVGEALAVTNGAKDGNAKGAALSAFWGSHQRFFNQVITSLQTPTVIDDMRRQIDAGNAVVIQLVNTNEATQEREVAKAQAEGIELEELDFTPRQVLMEYVANSFPVQAFEESTDDNGNTVYTPVKDKNGNPVFDKEAVAMRDALLANLEHIRVPENPIDAIIQAFGTENVGEVTGRGRRFVQQRDEHGNLKVVEEKRGKHASQNDAAAFQADKKPILIFSGAGGTGFSFHADLTAKNQRKRFHYILQPGWRADAAVQGFGRTHRTNQAQEPHYVLPTTNLKAQKRFVSSIARRLDQLGALTRGQRQATSQGLFAAADNLENGYAEDAMEALFNDMYRDRTSLNFHETTRAMGLEGMVDPKTGGLSTSKIPSVSRFLNRLLSLSVEMQDQVFGEFEQRLTEIVQFAIQNGTYDNGLQTLKAESIRKTRDDVAYTDARSGAKTNYVEVDVVNKIKYRTWEEARRFAANHGAKFVGWIRNPKQGVMAMVDLGKRVNAKGEEVQRGLLYGIRDHNNRYIDNLDEFKAGYIERWTQNGKKRYVLATPIKTEDAQAEWEKDVAAAPTTETHREHLIVGAILPIWDRVKGSPKIYRLQTDDGQRMIGRVVDKKEVDATLKNLGLGSTVAAMTPAQVLSAVRRGAKALLANGWSIESVTVSNDKRIEIGGSYFSAGEMAILRDQGVFFERIQWKDRAFIPTGDEGVAVFERITKSKPVVDLIEPGAENTAESPVESYNDPYATLETRPGTTEEQRQVGLDALRDAERSVFGRSADSLRGNRPSLLGLAINRDFHADGGTSFTGQQVSHPRDLAFLAQVLRDPRFETFRVFYTRGDTVVGQGVHSSRLPSTVYLPENFTQWLDDGKQRSGADGYWLVHNHPNGASRPSLPDMRLTSKAAEAVSGFKGHVIIDHNEYTTIRWSEDHGAQAETVVDSTLGSMDLRGNAAVPSRYLGEVLSGPRIAASLAKRMQIKDGFIAIIGADANLRISSITEIPDATATPKSSVDALRSMAMLRRMQRESGSTSLFAVVPGDFKEARYAKLMESRLFTDIVGQDGRSAGETGELAYSKDLRTRTDREGRNKSTQWFVEEPAYHGTPYEVDRFSTSKIGTGEGAQAYGWGLYFASAKGVAQHYKESLSDVSLTLNGKPISAAIWATGKTPEVVADAFASGRLVDALRYAKGANGKTIAAEAERLAGEAEKNARLYNDPAASRREALIADRLREFAGAAKAGDMAVSKGRLYSVELAPEPDEYLLWDKPLSEQSQRVRSLVESEAKVLGDLNREWTGEDFYRALSESQATEVDDMVDGGWSVVQNTINDRLANDEAASKYLHSIGIRGIKYLDGSSRHQTSEDWKVKSPAGMVHRFSSQRAADAYAKGREGYEITPPTAEYNYVIFDDNDVQITAMESRRIHGDRPTVNDFIVPETPEFDGNMGGDLGRIPDAATKHGVEALPIRLSVGVARGAHSGFGTLHIADNSDRFDARAVPRYTDDQAENIARHVALLARSFNQVFADTGRVIVRNERMGEALVLEKRTDQASGDTYYSVTTIRPAKTNVWGNPVWVGRLTFPTNELRQLGASTLSDGQEASQPSRIGQRNQTEHFNLTDGKEKKQADVSYRKRRAFTAKESRGGIIENTGASPAEIRRAFVKAFGESVVRSQERAGLIEIVPDAAALRVLLPGNRIPNSARALFINDRAYFIADRMRPATAHREALHEIGEHYGLKRMLGDKDYRALIDRVKAMRNSGDAYVSQAWNFVVREYIERESDPRLKLVEGSDRFMHEVLAQIGQNADIRAKSWWKAVIAAVRRWLAKTLGFSGVSVTDIQDMVLHSLKTAGRPQPSGPGGGIRGSRIANAAMASMTAERAAQIANQQKYLRRVTIASVTGNEFEPGSGFDQEPVDMKALRHAAKSWARKTIIGTYQNESSGLSLEVRAKGIDDALFHGGAADKVRALAGIPQLMERGIVVFDWKNPMNKQQRLVVVSGKMSIRGEDFFVTAGLRDGGDGKLFYDHELLEVERADEALTQSGRVGISDASGPGHKPAHLNDYTIAFLSQDTSVLEARARGFGPVDTESAEFKAWFGDSEVVDDEGNPLQVYHGTGSDFSTFKRSRRGWYGSGMYFTPDAGFAGEFDTNGDAANVMPVYLQMERPYYYEEVPFFAQDDPNDMANFGLLRDVLPESTAKNVIARLQREGTGYVGDVLRKALQDMGHDGLIVETPDGAEYIVFEPTQIKSAISNTGAFDPANPDIRYSLRDGYGREAFAASVLQELATEDALFRYPVSQSGSLRGVFHDVFPGVEWHGETTRADEKTDTGAEQRFTLKTPDTPAKDGKPELLGKQFDVYTTRDRVWLDVHRFQPGDQGARVYAAVANFAYNTRRVFGGDPAGVSADAVMARTKMMLASTLRFGTARHLDASPEQERGIESDGIPPLDWSGNDIDKVRALIHTFVVAAENLNPSIKDYSYDFAKRAFVRNSDRKPAPILQGVGGSPLESADDGSRDSGRTGTPRIGADSGRAAILIQSLIREEGRGIGDNGILQAVLDYSGSLVAEDGGLGGMLSRGNFMDEETADFLRNNRPAPIDRIRDITRNPDRWLKPVLDGVTDSLKGSPLFGPLDRTVHTQLHKAQKNPYFGAVFNRLQHFMEDSSRAALRPAELAPTILPRIDVAQSIRPAFEALLKGKAAAADIDAAFQAALTGTLEDTIYRSAAAANLTPEQFRIYREYRDSLDASLDELAAGEAWRIARTLFLGDKNRLTPDGLAMKKRMLDDPTEAAGILSGFLSRELDAATLRAQQLAGVAREKAPFIENTGDDKADMEKGLRDGNGNAYQADAMRRVLEAIERESALRDTRERVEKIFSRAQQLQGEGYAPLMRFGQHYLTVTRIDPATGETEVNEDGEKIVEYFSLFESAAERDTAEREMRDLYDGNPNVDFDSGTLSEKAWERYQGVSPESLALFAENFSVEIGEAFQQYYRVAASTRSTLKRLIHRKGTPGFSTDGSRVLAAFLTSNGRRAATLYHEGDIQEALSGFPRQMGREQDEAIELVRYVMDNPNEEAAVPRALMFMHFLGGTVSNFIINATQPAMVTLPYLSKTVGMPRAMALLREAYGIRNKPEAMSEELRAALERADQEGKVGAQEIHHLWQETARPIISKLGRFGDAVTYRAHAFMQLWGMPFAVAELMNRQVTFISAYNAAKESGKAPGQAYSDAIRAVDETQFIYGKQNRPNWARGTWGSMIFTFKLFSISYTELLVRLMREGPEGRRAGLYMLGMLFLAAGSQGMPGSDDLDDLIDTIAQMLGYNTSMKLSKRQFLENLAGKEFAGVAMHGLSALSPLDVSGRMSLGNLLPATSLLKPSNSKKESDLLEIMGPAGGLAMSYLNSADAVATGNWRRATTEWLPKAFKDMVIGAEMMASGEAKDTHGRRVVEVNPVEAAIKMAGFNPQAIAEVGRNARAVQQTISLATRTKGVITEKWARGIVDRNPDDVTAAKRDIERWNAANPETPITVKLSAVALRANAMRATKEDRFIKAATKEMKEYVKEAI